MNQNLPPELEVEEDRDDAVIGVALRYSLLVLIAFALIGGGIYLYVRWNQPAAPVAQPKPVELPKLRDKVAATLPLLPFSDITREAGINFVHENGAAGEKLLPETMGGGCAFLDYDSDGDQDILFVNSRDWSWTKAGKPVAESTLALYENDGTGKFTEVTSESGLVSAAYGQGCAVGDYDNDGDPDVYVTAIAEADSSSSAPADAAGPHKLFRNDGGKFVDVTAQAGVVGSSRDWGTSAGWFDCDNDGDLDLWVCNYVVWSREFDLAQEFRLADEVRAYGRPQVFPGTYNILYRNDGGGKFTDISQQAGLHVDNPVTKSPRGKSLGLSFADVDGDGWQDVIVANDTVQNFLFHNQGNGTFIEEGAASGVAFDANGNARGAMGIDIACPRDDVDCVSVVIGNFANEMSAYYVSIPGTTQFTDEAVANGLGPNTRLFLTFGVFFFDADLDGRLDLFHANGHLEEDISLVQASQTYEQSPQLFWNAGPKSLTEYVPLSRQEVGEDFVRPMVGRGAASADIDGDGDMDVLIAAAGHAPRLLRNDQKLGHNWLRLKLQGDGVKVNRDGIGARVDVTLSDGQVLRRTANPTRSYLSQCELPLTLGTGALTVSKVVVTWTNGEQQTIEAPAMNQTLLVTKQ